MTGSPLGTLPQTITEGICKSGAIFSEVTLCRSAGFSGINNEASSFQYTRSSRRSRTHQRHRQKKKRTRCWRGPSTSTSRSSTSMVVLLVLLHMWFEAPFCAECAIAPVPRATASSATWCGCLESYTCVAAAHWGKAVLAKRVCRVAV
eukprot:CAMPEP_0170614552 /NCGR_PEP_ID=MMETSP0224-20130122/24867_1 /TAXON_ID=285029 /ORGANISM="Togula jolla, Strain CCCM 725" /LENGTH=147 /DNA_ID=CAMNT_0010940229 /DNA_START=270 /DNA_END=714 /DNA_ORIENTATION=-